MLTFPGIIKSFSSALRQTRMFSNLKQYIHASQVASLTDSLIQVNEQDYVLGPIPKLESHLADAITAGMTHRAFSVFLFSKKSASLLVQKRCSAKIVFPREWANTCCSHPLFIESEMENVKGDQVGIKRAAVKRLGAELGISAVSVEGLSFKEKILYRQLSPGDVFGESECDYILVGELSEAVGSVVPNDDEVEAYEWVAPGPAGDRTRQLRSFLENETTKGFPPTPWFNLMVKEKECLETWWGRIIDDRSAFFREQPRHQVRNFLGVANQ